MEPVTAMIIMASISAAMTALSVALNYLLKPHTKKPNSFDSPTYGFQGMANSYDIGTPVNLPYGTIQVPPAIINWYRRGDDGKTRAYILGSLGHGQIAGVRGIKINDQSIKHYYSKFNKDCQIYITHGEYQQKVYKFCKEVQGYIISIDGTSPSKTLVLSVTNGRSLQSASAKEPGYVMLYSSSGTDTGKETYEIVRYLSASSAGSTWTLKGVRMTKSFSAADYFTQLYKIEKDDEGNVREVFPHFGSVTTFKQEINSIELTNSWSSIFTTHGKVDAFSTTFDFPEGLFKFDETEGFEAHQVQVRVRWRKVGESTWTSDVTEVSTALPGTENYINVSKNTNYAILSDINGAEITGHYDSFDYLNDIDEGMEIEFQGIKDGATNTFRYIIDSVIIEATGGVTQDDDGTQVDEYRGKIKFKSRLKPSENSKGKYLGGNVTGKSYTVYYKKAVNANSAKIWIPEKPKTIQSSYQVTYVFPRDGLGELEKMKAYDQYQIQYKLEAPTTAHNTNKDAHKIVITSIEDIKMDDLVYPGEALIGMRLLMTEKISGAIDNITAVVDGLLVKDTSEDTSGDTQWQASTAYSSLTDGSGQPIRRRALSSSKDCKHVYRLIKTGTSGSTEPDWLPVAGAVIYDGNVPAGTHCEWQEDSCKWNDNPLDIICDLQQNKLYGRGQYLDFDNTVLSELYDSYNVNDSNGVTDREYCEHNITENSKTRKRFSVNMNIDFRQPLMDTLEVLAKSTRAYNYWDGKKLLTFIDRYRAPVTMVNNANIIDGSFAIEEVNVEDKINRIYAQILNRYRGYKQDQVGRDYTDEGFTIGNLVMEQIHLYGISDKWRALKILAYMLKYSKYIKHVTKFDMALDGCLIDIGDVIYLSHESVNNSVQIGSSKKWQSTCGRVIAVSGATFTTDKDVTISNGQKVLLRKTDGTVGTYTIQSQVGRVITVNTTISSVSPNSIYSLGTEDSNTEYYRQFAVISKKYNGYTYEFLGITFDSEVFKDLYDTNVISEEYSGSLKPIVEENDALASLDSPKSLPPPVTKAVIKEDPLVQGEAVVYITKPISGTWAYAEAYFKNMDSEEWRYVGRTTGDPLRVTGLVAGEVYEYEIKSFSQNVNSSDAVIHGVFTYGEEAKALPSVTGLQIANRMGKESSVYGRAFKIRWDDMTSKTKDSLTYAMRKAGYEKLKYYIEVYFPEINSLAKIGNSQVRNMVARYETIDINKFKYDYEDTMEDISKIFENYSSNSYYNTYYNVPIRTVKFKVYTINDYSQKSDPKEITLTNPAPGFYQSNGVTLVTPTLKKLKSGIKVSFPHPYDSNGDEEYDISHFIIERCENSGFSGGTLKKRKVMSSVTVNSNDEEISDASYQEDFKGLDPKKTYYFRVKPYDVFGVGTSSQTSSLSPGTTDDDEEDSEDKIEKPQKVEGLVLSINSSNNVVISWTSPSGTHATDVTKAIIDWRGRQGVTGTPTLQLRPSGDIPTLEDVDDGDFGGDTTKTVVGEKKSAEINLDESETHAKNRYVIKGAKTGYTYFARVRFENSSRKQGQWSDWAYNTVAVEGVSADDMPSKWAMYKFTGSVTAYNATQITWVGGTGVLKRKTQSGSSDITINTQATPQTITPNATMFLCYTGSATLELKTEAQLDADSSYVAIAKCTTAPSGKCKVLMMVSSEHFRISAYEAGFNLLSAVTADLGEVTAGTLTGTTIQTGTSNPKVLINSSGITVYNSSGSTTLQISNDGSGSIGDKISWTTGGVVTVSGVVADSVAAEDIIAGTITGSTLRTAASGKRFVVSSSIGEAEFYGDEDGGAGESIVKLATIGITQSGSDYYIGDFGNINSTNTRGAIRARSYSGEAIQAQCGGSANAINANASSGHGISAQSTTGFGGQFFGNATSAPILIVPRDYTTKPTTLSAGSLAFDSSINKLICYDGTAWQPLW